MLYYLLSAIWFFLFVHHIIIIFLNYVLYEGALFNDLHWNQRRFPVTCWTPKMFYFDHLRWELLRFFIIIFFFWAARTQDVINICWNRIIFFQPPSHYGGGVSFILQTLKPIKIVSHQIDIATDQSNRKKIISTQIILKRMTSKRYLADESLSIRR